VFSRLFPSLCSSLTNETNETEPSDCPFVPAPAPADPLPTPPRAHQVDKPTEDWKGTTGYVNASLIETHLPKPSEDSMIFVCGPPGMMNVSSEGRGAGMGTKGARVCDGVRPPERKKRRNREEKMCHSAFRPSHPCPALRLCLTHACRPPDRIYHLLVGRVSGYLGAQERGQDAGRSGWSVEGDGVHLRHGVQVLSEGGVVLQTLEHMRQ